MGTPVLVLAEGSLWTGRVSHVQSRDGVGCFELSVCGEEASQAVYFIRSQPWACGHQLSKGMIVGWQL